MAKFKEILAKLNPYRDIIVFVVVLFASNALWKLMICGDDYSTVVTWFGIDVTAQFNALAQHIAYVSAAIASIFRDTVHWIAPNYIRFDSGSCITIVWSCTAIKQSFIWLCLMLTVSGNWKHRMWFIPMGWVCIYAFNILRITAIALIIEHHIELFDLMHTYIFKYLFYGMMFLLWVWWEEKIKWLKK